MPPRWAIPAALFALVFLAHALSPVITSFDSRWSVHLATSLVSEGNLDLDEYRDALRADNFYAVECRRSHVADALASFASASDVRAAPRLPVCGSVPDVAVQG